MRLACTPAFSVKESESIVSPLCRRSSRPSTPPAESDPPCRRQWEQLPLWCLSVGRTWYWPGVYRPLAPFGFQLTAIRGRESHRHSGSSWQFQMLKTVEVAQTHNYLEGARRITACGSERRQIVSVWCLVFERSVPSISTTPHGNLKQARSKMPCCVLLASQRPRAACS